MEKEKHTAKSVMELFKQLPEGERAELLKMLEEAQDGNEDLEFTKEHISELICKHAQKENGLHDLMEIMLESMMVAERDEFLTENQWDKGNGYRPGHA